MYKVTVKNHYDGEISIWGEYKNLKEAKEEIRKQFIETALWGKKFDDSEDDTEYRQSLIDEAKANADSLINNKKFESDECTLKLIYVSSNKTKKN